MKSLECNNLIYTRNFRKEVERGGCTNNCLITNL